MITATEAEIANNRSTASHWNCYSDHRRHVMAWIQKATKAVRNPRHVGVIGAGNLNDISLTELLQSSDTIELIDIDRVAVLDGVARQLERDEKVGAKEKLMRRLTIVAPVDVTGITHLLIPQVNARTTSANEDPIDKVVRELASTSPFCKEITPEPASLSWSEKSNDFDLLVSSSILSQLVRQVTDAFGKSAEVPGIAQLLITVHLERLVAATRPGGCAVLITDFASNRVNAPELREVRNDGDLTAVARKLLKDERQFLGLGPSNLLAIAAAPLLRSYIREIELTSYWIWKSSTATYRLCYAMMLRRSLAAFPSRLTNSSKYVCRLKEFAARTGVAVSSFPTRS